MDGGVASRQRRSALAGIIAALSLAVMSLSPASAGAAVPVPGIKVFDAGSATQLVHIRTLSCRRRNVLIRGVRFNDFQATARVGAWYLRVAIDEFGGYRRYEIPRGDNPDNLPYFTLSGPSGLYNNIAKPPAAILPPVGGWVTFPNGPPRLYVGNTMGLGYVNAWNNGLSAAVTIAGIATCRYPVPVRR